MELVFRKILLLFITLFSIAAMAQQSGQVRIESKVIDTLSPHTTFNLMVVNKRTQHGFFADASGEFSLYANKTDTIMVGAIGYKTFLFSLKDSVPKEVYKFTIYPEKLKVELKPIEFFSPRELSEIHKDIEKLGFEKSEHMLQGIDAAQSPITFLYQAFSKREQHKRQVAEWENEDRKRELLKELLTKYVDGGIIRLNDVEFDSFIDFTSVPEEFMKRSTQYEFIMFIKKKYELYVMIKK